MLEVAGIQIAGAGELARLLKVERSTIRRWSQQEGFPPCLGEVANIPVWDARLVIVWNSERDAPRRRLIQHYLTHGSHIRAANHVGIAPRTAKKWLMDAGAMDERDLAGE